MTNTLNQSTQFGGEYYDAEAIQTVMKELERRHKTAVDIQVPAKAVTWQVKTTTDLFDPNAPIKERHSELQFTVPGVIDMDIALPMRKRAFDQITTGYPIGGRYARILERENPELLSQNMNHWLQQDDRIRLLRSLDNEVRAWLSNSFAPYDSSDLGYRFIDAVTKKGAEVVRLEVTDDNFWARALQPDWEVKLDRQLVDVREKHQVFQHRLADLTKDKDGNVPYFERGAAFQDIPDEDWIVGGLEVSNSEVGQGGLQVKRFAVRRICINGTVMDTVMNQVHRERPREWSGFLSPETIQKEHELVWAVVSDAIEAALDKTKFMESIDKMNAAANDVIEDPVKVVTGLFRDNHFSDDDKQRLINNLVTGGDPTRWGLVNAITAMAHTTPNIEEQHRFEEIGGRELVRVPA
jgi:hypothetical protein